MIPDKLGHMCTSVSTELDIAAVTKHAKCLKRIGMRQKDLSPMIPCVLHLLFQMSYFLCIWGIGGVQGMFCDVVWVVSDLYRLLNVENSRRCGFSAFWVILL